MPKGSEELIAARKEEIITVCAELYKTMSFKDITIKEIGNATSFTRTSIYNYFQTKEEIFLALLQREYELWNGRLKEFRSGHEVIAISAAHGNISPCTGCVSCGYDGSCVQKDDMEHIRKEILGADMLVFVTPLYYYGMSAQLKILIDRFCAINGSIQRKKMKSVLISAAWNSDNWTFEALEAHLPYPGKIPEFPGPGHGSGKGLRDAVHDGRQRIPGDGLQTWKIAGLMIKRRRSFWGMKED